MDNNDQPFASDITLDDARAAIAGRNEFREHDFGDHIIMR
jgi:hypothetical protein